MVGGIYFRNGRTRLSSEHNQMSSELHFQQAFVGTVSQTTEIVLAGESSNAPVPEDETILVPCNLNNGVVTYTGAYTAADYVTGQAATYPEVTIDVTKLLAAANVVDGIFTDEDSADSLDPLYGSAPTLQGLFRNEPWDFPGPVSTANPLEAVISVTYGAITATSLASAVGSGSWGPSSAAADPAVNLFEQCLAAGKVSGSTLSDANGQGAAAFAVGDSLSVYVTYTLTKTRSYSADSDLSGAAAVGGTATITVGGVTVGSTPVLEVATPVTKVYRWKFVNNTAPVV